MAEASAGKNYAEELKLVERKAELDANNALVQKILDGVSKEQADASRIEATQSQSQTSTINKLMEQFGPMLQQAMSPQQAPMRQPTQGLPTQQQNQLPTADQSGPIKGVPTDFLAAMRQKRGDLAAIKEQLKAAASRSSWDSALLGKKTYNQGMYEALQKESGLTKDEINALATESGISQGQQRIKLSERQLDMLEQEYKRKAAREPFDDTIKTIDTFAKDTENPALVKREIIRAAAQFTVDNKREPTRQELLAIAGSLPTGILKGKVADKGVQYTGPYVDGNGVYLGEGFFDKASAAMMLRDKTGKNIPMPGGARPITETNLDRNVMTGEQFSKLAKASSEEEQSLRALRRYWDSVKDTSQGWRLLADQYIAEMKTIFGKKLDDQKQFDTLIQSGQLQGLLGRFRKDIVGAGVMTEQDAHRVVAALGGDVSALRNKEVVAQLLQNIFSDKAKAYNEVTVPLFNAQITGGGRGSFKTKDPVKVDDIFTKRSEIPAGARTATSKDGKKVYWNGSEWVPVE